MEYKNRKNKEWLNDIARIIKKKDGGYMLVFGRRKDKDGNMVGKSPFPLTINEGDILNAQNTKTSLDKMVKQKKMKQETADSIAQNVKFNISIPPNKDAKGDEEDEEVQEEKPKKNTKPSSKKNVKDEEETEEESDDEDSEDEDTDDEDGDEW